MRSVFPSGAISKRSIECRYTTGHAWELGEMRTANLNHRLLGLGFVFFSSCWLGLACNLSFYETWVFTPIMEYLQYGEGRRIGFE